MSDFTDRHVVVTGGTGALGTAVVGHLVAQGATCHVVDRSEANSANYPHGGHARVWLYGGVDLCDEERTGAFFADLPELWASVNIAGGFGMSPLTETSLADFRRMLEINLVTAFLSCREAVRAIRRTGGVGGRLVNIVARPALVPVGGMVAYSAAKAGVAALTTALAEELRGEHVLVNAIAPSVIDTPSNRQAMPKARHETWPKPAELARTVAFLASPANLVTSGAIVPVYGGA